MGNTSRSGFGRYLARAMVGARFTTAGQLASAIGVDRSLVSRWLNNDHQVSIKHLRLLAPVLKLNPLDLLIEAGYYPRHELEDAALDYTERLRADRPVG